MNSLAKFIASIFALIASLSFARIALVLAGTIPNHAARVTVYNRGEVDLSGGFELKSSFGGFDITHSGSVEMTHQRLVFLLLTLPAIRKSQINHHFALICEGELTMISGLPYTD